MSVISTSPLVWSVHRGPLGEMLLIGDTRALTGLYFDPHRGTRGPWERCRADGRRDDADPVLAEADRQLSEYFDRGRTDFDLPLAAAGSAFQHRVWDALRRIPFGTTVSYGSIAAELGLPPGGSRAVGLANGSNPIAVVVPCHRVIGADGSLTGYAGGLERKRHLLDLESSGTTLF
jgi:methylated-DNA-[protein]-cysteine S-methyltransferase